MTRRMLIRAAEWTLSAETVEGAPRGIFGAECLTCAARSELVDDDPLPVEVWMLKHTGLNPGHRQFRFSTESFCRVDPAPGNPYHEIRRGEIDA